MLDCAKETSDETIRNLMSYAKEKDVNQNQYTKSRNTENYVGQ